MLLRVRHVTSGCVQAAETPTSHMVSAQTSQQMRKSHPPPHCVILSLLLRSAVWLHCALSGCQCNHAPPPRRRALAGRRSRAGYRRVLVLLIASTYVAGMRVWVRTYRKLPNSNPLWNCDKSIYPDPNPYQTPPRIYIYIRTQTAGTTIVWYCTVTVPVVQY